MEFPRELTDIELDEVNGGAAAAAATTTGDHAGAAAGTGITAINVPGSFAVANVGAFAFGFAF